MDPNYIYFPALPGLPLTFEPLPPEKKEQKKIQVQFVLLTYSLEHGQTPGSSPLKKTVSPPPAEATNCEELTLRIPITIFRSSFQWISV